MTMPGVEPALADMMDAVFAEHGSDDDLWDRLDALGLVRLTGPEETGGSGAGWVRGGRADVGRGAPRGADAVGRDTIFWPAGSSTRPAMRYDAAVRTVCLLDADGAAEAVPWASRAERIVAIWPHDTGYLAADVAAGAVAITAGREHDR